MIAIGKKRWLVRLAFCQRPVANGEKARTGADLAVGGWQEKSKLPTAKKLELVRDWRVGKIYSLKREIGFKNPTLLRGQKMNKQNSLQALLQSGRAHLFAWHDRVPVYNLQSVLWFLGLGYLPKQWLRSEDFGLPNRKKWTTLPSGIIVPF